MNYKIDDFYLIMIMYLHEPYCHVPLYVIVMVNLAGKMKCGNSTIEL